MTTEEIFITIHIFLLGIALGIILYGFIFPPKSDAIEFAKWLRVNAIHIINGYYIYNKDNVTYTIEKLYEIFKYI